MWPPHQKSGSCRLTLQEPFWLSWLETFHMYILVQVNTTRNVQIQFSQILCNELYTSAM